jgi:uncharacterized membrane protein YphA (DoxX/SURF4 family)
MAGEIREFVVGFVGVIIGITVAVSLLPIIPQSIAAANLTGTSALILGLLTLLVAVGIVLFVVKAMY